jgi:hypothetical protein
VIPDGPGYPLFSATGGALLFHLPGKLCERTSVVITTNITTNLSFSEWAFASGPEPVVPSTAHSSAMPG